MKEIQGKIRLGVIEINNGAVPAKDFMSISEEKMVDSVILSNITEEQAAEFVESILGETKINDVPIRTYKEYGKTISRLYPFRLSGDLSPKLLDELWDNGGRKTTKFFHSSAKESLISLLKANDIWIKKWYAEEYEHLPIMRKNLCDNAPDDLLLIKLKNFNT